ncbi:MAG: APC family permease [Sporichthyaceae bacterium]
MPDTTIIPRRLGPGAATVVGCSAMLGAGVFVVWTPAAAAAGAALPLALALAALVAWCNADSSARLAARHPQSGGAYVYGREQLGPFWGYLAGWAFVTGKSASCAAMALAVGAYAWPDHAGTVAAAVVVGLTALNCLGVHRSALVGAVIVAVVLAVLAAVVVVALGSDAADAERLRVNADAGVAGVLEAAGLLFFAFAGYARLATLGEEVRDPARTIPRAIRRSLAIVLVVYAAVLAANLAVLGPDGMAATATPLAELADAAGAERLEWPVRTTATLAAAGALLALLLGVSRTTLAMARDGHLPRPLATVRAGRPLHAELAVGAVVAVLAATLDLRGAIGFSSFGVLLYYAIANASAWTLGSRAWAGAGLGGCLVLAFALPAQSVVVGLAVLAVGAVAYAIRRRV